MVLWLNFGKLYRKEEMVFMVKRSTFTILGNCVCLLLVILLMASQIVPYWTFECGDYGTVDIAIGDYVWFPNEDITDEFEELVKEEVFPGQKLKDKDVVNEIVMFPAIIFALCAVALAAFILKHKNAFLPAIATFIASVVGIVGYFLTPALMLSAAWMLHVVLFSFAAVVSLIFLVLNIIYVTREKKEEKIANGLA